MVLLDTSCSTGCNGVLVKEVIAAVRAALTARTYVKAALNLILSSSNIVGFGVDVYREGYERRFSCGPLHVSPYDRADLLARRLEVALGGGAHPVEVEAAIAAIRMQKDIEALMIGLCAPDASARVTTGAWTEFADWGPPVRAFATYHADAASVVRDLALSWVNLHYDARTPHIAGMSLTALTARVGAAPRTACVTVASGVELPREAVLGALAAPPGALLEALEAAAAVPDAEWRAVEPLALETIEATRAGAPTYEVDVSTRKHVQFIERHAPYHVRRLPNGGVLLATHPYRTLWQLYADALFLLGITP
ncbi:MAG: hypothetical protein ABI134_07475 [Byssovorax sp.]